MCTSRPRLPADAAHLRRRRQGWRPSAYTLSCFVGAADAATCAAARARPSPPAPGTTGRCRRSPAAASRRSIAAAPRGWECLSAIRSRARQSCRAGRSAARRCRTWPAARPGRWPRPRCAARAAARRARGRRARRVRSAAARPARPPRCAAAPAGRGAALLRQAHLRRARCRRRILRAVHGTSALRGRPAWRAPARGTAACEPPARPPPAAHRAAGAARASRGRRS
mmetsp:Transcript_58349/g.160169  ORF Transcript_58349/g.160169 Transcript_58349/m.160169 type:complete len:226 (-) Transcript_58349:174-851(-)